MTARVSATTLALCAALALTALPDAARAQAKTGSLGGGAGAGPIMTRDELRACLKNQAELKARVADYEAQKAAAEKEKADILAANQALAEEKAKLGAEASRVKDENARAANLAQRVDEWNERWQAFEKSGKAGPMADRERKRLIDEQKALQREQEAMKAAVAGAGGEAGAASAFNQKVEALNARTAAYNNRNKELVKLGEDLQQERDLWAGECGNRRYREEDEIAIKQGK